MLDVTEGVGGKEGDKVQVGASRVDERSQGGDELLLKHRWCYRKLNEMR